LQRKEKFSRGMMTPADHSAAIMPHPECPKSCEACCASQAYLVGIIVVLVLLCLIFLSTSFLLWIRPGRLRVSSKSEKKRKAGEPPTLTRINSFTVMQLKAEGEPTPRSVIEMTEHGTSQSIQPKVKNGYNTQKSFEENGKVKSFDESGKFRRFDSDLYKGASRTSLGVTNSISHSSYNSANEELQFDLYDYDPHGMNGQPATFDFEERSRTGHLWDAFSLSDFAPTKLFPEDEQSLVKTGSKGSIGWKNLAALSVSSLSKALFQPEEKEEDVVAKDEKPAQQMVESVTSDLTCSITSDLSQNTLKDEDSNAFWNRSSFKETNLYQEQPTHSRCLSYKERNKSIIITETPSDQTPVLSPQPPSPPCTKPPEDENNCPTLDINDTKTFTDYYSFPPITLIDDLEVWDEEEEEEEENI